LGRKGFLAAAGSARTIHAQHPVCRLPPPPDRQQRMHAACFLLKATFEQSSFDF